MKVALLLIDIQNDYFPGGKMTLANMEEATDNAVLLLNKFREKKLPIFHIQHVSTKPEAFFLLPATKGAEIHARVLPLQSEHVIQKHYPNSFKDTFLLKNLQANQITHLVIAGAMSHMCIDSTTRAAFDHHFHCTVIDDACATRDLEYGETVIPAAMTHAAFMSALGFTFASVRSTQAFLEDF